MRNQTAKNCNILTSRFNRNKDIIILLSKMNIDCYIGT